MISIHGHLYTLNSYLASARPLPDPPKPERAAAPEPAVALASRGARLPGRSCLGRPLAARNPAEIIKKHHGKPSKDSKKA